MGETISVSQFKAGRGVAAEPLTRAALEAILRDEVRHSTLGWSAVAELLPLLTEGERSQLDLEVTKAFAGFERRIAIPALARLENGDFFDPKWTELGVLRRVIESFWAVDRRSFRSRPVGLRRAAGFSRRYRRWPSINQPCCLGAGVSRSRCFPVRGPARVWPLPPLSACPQQAGRS